jgi:membrane fusion protein (multidrug efflux system)
MNAVAEVSTVKTEPSVSNQNAGGAPFRRKLLFSLLAVAVVAAGGAGAAYWKLVASHYVSTDNAYTAAEVAQVAAEIEGPVAEVRVVDSQKVKKGDILVTIDPTDVKLVLAQSEADLARAKAQLAAATADADRSAIDLGRRQALVDSGSVSGDELTRVQSTFNTTRSAVAAARAGVTLAQARFDKAAIDVERTIIRSPVDGVIARREVQLGQRVQPSMPLLSVVPVQEMYVNANFKEVQLRAVHPGQHVKLSSDLYGDRVEFHGRVEGFSGGTGSAFALIPSQNATGNWIKVVQRLPVRVDLDPAELEAHPLRVGLSMNVKVDLTSQD